MRVIRLDFQANQGGIRVGFATFDDGRRFEYALDATGFGQFIWACPKGTKREAIFYSARMLAALNAALAAQMVARLESMPVMGIAPRPSLAKRVGAWVANHAPSFGFAAYAGLVMAASYAGYAY